MATGKTSASFINSLGKIYGGYAGGFVGFTILLAILEQVGLPNRVIGYAFVVLTIGVYAYIGILSRKRDRYALPNAPIYDWQGLVDFINRQNDLWMQATRRISPNVLRDLLHLTGPQVSAFFATLDPNAIGMAVSWAGPDPAPVWLDLAREYTERWHHQQQIREAVGQPLLLEPRWFEPLLDIAMRVLPAAYRLLAAVPGTALTITVANHPDGRWTLRRATHGWMLERGLARDADCAVQLSADQIWRLLFNALTAETARRTIHVEGDATLAEPFLRARAVVV